MIESRVTDQVENIPQGHHHCRSAHRVYRPNGI
jgi:hypothetical protein